MQLYPKCESGYYISKERLETLCSNPAISIQDICKAEGCSKDDLKKFLRFYKVRKLAYKDIAEKDLTREKLYQLYVIENLSTLKIANLYKTDQKYIIEWIKKYNLHKLTNDEKFQNSPNLKEELKVLYLEKQLNVAKIATLYGLSSSNVVSAKLKELGYFKLPQETLFLKNPPSKEELERLYIKEDKRLRDLQKLFGVSDVLISDLLKKYGLTKQSRKKLWLEEQKDKKDYFLSLFIKEKLSQVKIAKKLEVPINYISSVFNFFSIPNTREQYYTENPIKKELLEDLYMVKGYSMAELGLHFGVTPSFLSELLSNYGLLRNFSSLEAKVLAFLDKEGFVRGKDYEIGNCKVLKGKELDIYFPREKVAIELNGSYWHSYPLKARNYHREKFLACREIGIRLIQIWEHDWAHKEKILSSILLNALGKRKLKYYARNCYVEKVSKEAYKTFCELNHVQGYKAARVIYGLYSKDGILRQVASFSTGRYNTAQWEWIRGCIASNNSVVGGTSKLLKQFIKDYNPSEILCYADANLFDGKGYEQAGFKLLGVTAPNKFYIVKKDLVRIERNPSKYQKYKQLVNNGTFLLGYGAGNLKYLWTK